MRTRPGAFLVDPVDRRAGAPDPARAQDRFAAEHLLDTATGLVRDVARMQAAAAEQGTRLLTFTLETEIGFARPGDVEAFVLDLARAIEEIGRRHSGRPGRPYRVVIGGHPAARGSRRNDDRAP